MSSFFLKVFSSITLIIIYVFNICCMLFSIGSPMFNYPGFSYLGLLSIILFSIIIIISTLKKDQFFFFLPFVILAFPNVINDFFPSFLMGPRTEYRVASFSFITHIDIYLLFGLYLNKNYNHKILENQNFRFLTILTFLLSIFFLLTIVNSNSIESLSLFAIGNYQIRYILLFILFLSTVKLNNSHIRLIIYGLSLSIIFLFIESSIFTISTGRPTLGSGTLAANVFANITAAITIFFLFLKQKTFNLPKIFYYHIRISTIIIGFLILILNGTRMAMFSFFISALVFYIRTSFKVETFFQFFVKMIYYGLFFLIFLTIALQFERFSGAITILIDLFNLNIKLNESTASLFARLHLYKVSLNMTDEHWLLGIGPGRWNYLKYNYDYQNIGTLLVDTLMDPHNDYLSYISQYGLFIGSAMIFFVLLKPALQFLSKPEDSIYFFGLIPFTLLISGITNSNTLKHQIFATVMMIILIMYQKLNKKNVVFFKEE